MGHEITAVLVSTQVHAELMEAYLQRWVHTPAGQATAQEAARLDLGTDEMGQFFHSRMLQAFGRRVDSPSREQLTAQQNQVSTELHETRCQVHETAQELRAEDEEVVGRIVALGFGHSQVIEAYVACDRNETFAANFLMDQQ